MERLRQSSCSTSADSVNSGQAAIVERALVKRPGVVKVEANPVSQTATVTFDPWTSVADLKKWVEECGFHCAGQSVRATEYRGNSRGARCTFYEWRSGETAAGH